MIIFVDYEHARAHTAKWGEKLLAARTRITYRLEDLAGQHCMLVRYDRVTPGLIDKLEVEAIFISGNGTDPSLYSTESLAPLRAIVRETDLPMFGFCGGFQFIAEALGSEVVALEPARGVAEVGESTDPTADAKAGGPIEFGYLPVDVHVAGGSDTGAVHPVLEGLGDAPVFRHAHSLHVPSPPDGFDVLASTPITPVQVAINDEQRIVGTQFHPEYWTNDYPDGERMISNFLRWSGVTR